MSAYTVQAESMLAGAGMLASSDDVRILADDIRAVASDIDWEHDAARGRYELQRRIGGLGNLSAYMDCLRKGQS